MRIVEHFLIFFFYSFVGWALEVLYAFYIHRRFVNRGFINGALCPMYGVSGLLAVLLLSPLERHPAFVFLAGAALISAIEFLTGFLMERFFSARWWDYSDRRFNLLGYISLDFSLLWGGLSLALIYGLNPLMYRFFALFPDPFRLFAAIILTAFFSADLGVSVWSAFSLAGTVREIQDFLGSLPEKLDRTMNRIQDGRIYLRALKDGEEWSSRLRFFQRRLMHSFPEMRYRHFTEAFDVLREATETRIRRRKRNRS